jgi:hypothetical protein
MNGKMASLRPVTYVVAQLLPSGVLTHMYTGLFRHALQSQRSRDNRSVCPCSLLLVYD